MLSLEINSIQFTNLNRLFQEKISSQQQHLQIYV